MDAAGYNTYDLTEEQLDLYMDAFKLFDRLQDGRIRTNDLAPLLRALGHNPTEGEVKDVIQDYDRTDTGFLSFQKFLLLMSSSKLHKESAEDFIKAFAVFDKAGTGKIDAEDFLVQLQSLGDTLTKEQAYQMISNAKADEDGLIDINQFVAHLMNS